MHHRSGGPVLTNRMMRIVRRRASAERPAGNSRCHRPREGGCLNSRRWRGPSAIHGLRVRFPGLRPINVSLSDFTTWTWTWTSTSTWAWTILSLASYRKLDGYHAQIRLVSAGADIADVLPLRMAAIAHQPPLPLAGPPCRIRGGGGSWSTSTSRSTSTTNSTFIACGMTA
jgi:hypothetical protein